MSTEAIKLDGCHILTPDAYNGVWDKTGTTRTSSSPRSSGWPSAAVAFSVPGSRPCHRHTSCATTMGGGSARSGRATTAVRGGGSSTASHTGSRRSARRTPDGASRPIPKEAGSRLMELVEKVGPWASGDTEETT